MQISIHVPRAGYDNASKKERKQRKEFLSTYPVRGTTFVDGAVFTLTDISIHVPRAGYDGMLK